MNNNFEQGGLGAAVAGAAGCPPVITVAICTRNRAALLAEAVRSVLPQLCDDSEVVIVDNSSTDETASVAAGFAAANQRVRVFSETEIGLSVTRNTALAEARGRYVIFLDDDATAEDGWVKAYRRFFLDPPSARVVGAGGAVFPRYEHPPPAWFDPEAHSLDWGGDPRAFARRGGPWGCNFAVERKRAIELGGFSVSYGRKGKSMAAHEETEIFQRFQRSGWEMWWLPGARIRHLVPASRLTLKFQCRVMFSFGRSSASLRWQSVSGGMRRTLFVCARLVATPFQVMICLVGGLGMVIVLRNRIAAKLLLHSARVAGFAYQLTLDALGVR